jgi:septal ring-binding cell division protein DamX
MSEPKPFASLSPSLLARKGAARPAMRPHLQPMPTYHDSLARSEAQDPGADLGWNDMGHDPETPLAEEPVREVVPIAPAVTAAPPVVPEVVRQQEAVARHVAAAAPAPASAPARRSALASGRRAAFTLRVDSERHLKLRLACTIRNRSAQQLVTEALDRLLAELPDIDSLAAQVGKRR